MKTLSDDQAKCVHVDEVCPHCGSSLDEGEWPIDATFDGMKVAFNCNKCRLTFTIEYKLVEVIEE